VLKHFLFLCRKIFYSTLMIYLHLFWNNFMSNLCFTLLAFNTASYHLFRYNKLSYFFVLILFQRQTIFFFCFQQKSSITAIHSFYFKQKCFCLLSQSFLLQPQNLLPSRSNEIGFVPAPRKDWFSLSTRTYKISYKKVIVEAKIEKK